MTPTEKPTARGPELSRRSAAAAPQGATVVANLTNGLFRLRLSDGREATGHVSQDMRMAVTRLLPGDAVRVSLSPFDPNRARILQRLDRDQQSQHETPPSQPQQRETS